MTREEQINEAVNTYMNGLFEDGIEIPIEDFENIEEGFIAGAAWADANPKSPWISVEDDLPCNHGELMRQKEVREGTETIDVFAASKSGLIWNDYMMYENGKWRWNGNNFEPDFWMLAPKLPKE